MCFSATASFGSGVVLAAIGVSTLKLTRKPSHLVFACIPFLFAIQQVSEGFVWLTLQRPEYAKWQSLPIHVFMVFAHIVWPFWITLSALLLEPKAGRKKILTLLFGVAIVLSGSEIYYMAQNPISAEVSGHHVQYIFDYPPIYVTLTGIVYGLVTIVPCFISSIKRMWLLGVCFTASLLFSAFFYQAYLLSVWCFFAAILSIIIYLIIDHHQKLEKLLMKATAQIKDNR
jgi:hypothetical protein